MAPTKKRKKEKKRKKGIKKNRKKRKKKKKASKRTCADPDKFYGLFFDEFDDETTLSRDIHLNDVFSVSSCSLEENSKLQTKKNTPTPLHPHLHYLDYVLCFLCVCVFFFFGF